MSKARTPKKVLHVLNSAIGGAAMSTLGLIHSLEKRGVASCAVCHDAGTPEERKMLADAVHGEVIFTPLYWWNRKTRLPYWLRPAFELRQGVRTMWALRSAHKVQQAARRFDAELIHTNTILTPEGGMAAAQLRLPHVWHVRELVGPDKPFRFFREGPAFGDFASKHASKLIANSQVTAAQLDGWLPPGLLEVVPNGIDLARFGPAKPRSGRIVVAMVGGMNSRWKKHDLFVKAALRVDRKLPVEFRIYGHDDSYGGTRRADSYTHGLHDLIASGHAESRFSWPGFLADPARIMSEIDILVHPADHESFGRVLVEAMAAHLPVIGVNAGGAAEIVLHDETGVLVPADDVGAMAAAIEALAQDPERRRLLGEAGRKRAVERYSLDACAEGILAVYQSAMERPLVPLSPFLPFLPNTTHATR
jgi:glycosyltransferase involved in cell wall biosynthesis